jgi:hypothetical protein
LDLERPDCPGGFRREVLPESKEYEMSTKLLISTAALLASVAIGAAQNAPGEHERSGATPNRAAQGQLHQERNQREQTTGQANREQQAQRPEHQNEQAAQKAEPRSGQAQNRGNAKPGGTQGEQANHQNAQHGEAGQNARVRETTGQSAQRQRTEGTERSGSGTAERNQGQAGKPNTTGQGASQAQGAAPREGQRGQAAQRNATQGRGNVTEGQRESPGESGQTQQNAGQQGTPQQPQQTVVENAQGQKNLSADQSNRIRETVLNGPNVPRENNVNFQLHVGTTVPARMRLVEVPPTLIDIYPDWRGDRYFVVRDEIVIVDRTEKIVGLVPMGRTTVQLPGGPGFAGLSTGMR